MGNSNFWNDDWANLQRQYWEQWSQLQQKAMGIEPEPPKPQWPWEQGLEHWWQAVQPAMPEAGQLFFEKMMEQGKSFLQMANQFSNMDQASAGEEAWAGMLRSLTESFTRNIGGVPGDQASFAFWEMPMDNWQRMVSAMSPVPGDMLRGMPTDEAGVKEHVDRVLGAPGLGYTRENQAQYQSLIQAAIQYQETLAEYALFFTRMGENAGKRLQSSFSGKSVESARELYDTWVRCCEEEYAEQVMTPEYIDLHGRLVNALMQLKHRWGEILNEYLSAMNIPTSDDLRTMQMRVQEHRREIRKLHKEIAALRSEIQEQPAPRPAPARKAASKKKAVAKKKTATKKKVAKKKAVAKKKVTARKR